MEAIVECCAGLDVHQATVVACLNNGRAGARSSKETRTYGTTGLELREMRDWLKASGCTLVAMESSGVDWKPVHAELEGHFELIVGNAHHIRQRPPHQECAGAQDGRERQRLDQRARASWPDRQQFRATPSDPRAARSDALPAQVG